MERLSPLFPDRESRGEPKGRGGDVLVTVPQPFQGNEDIAAAKPLILEAPLGWPPNGGRILTTLSHTAGDAPLTGRFWLPAMAGKDVTQNGLPAKAIFHLMRPSGTDRASLPFELPPGAEMKIEHADR